MPLAVGGDPEARHGIVLDSQLYCKEKRSEDRNGTYGRQNMACPDLIIVPPRMDLYLRFSSMAKRNLWGVYGSRSNHMDVMKPG